MFKIPILNKKFSAKKFILLTLRLTLSKPKVLLLNIGEKAKSLVEKPVVKTFLQKFLALKNLFCFHHISL
jgi:hypothetical protein